MMMRPTKQRSQWMLGALVALILLVGLALIWLLPADERIAAYGGVLALAYTAVLICLFALRSAPRAMPVGLGFLWGMPASAVMMIVAFVLRP